MGPISGREALLETLKQEGVSCIFGNPGSTELPLMDALAGQNEIRYFLALHEGVAVSMADGYARASGRLGVVNVHISPGLGNSIGMLYNAYKSGSPLLITAGQQDQSFAITEPILWSDLPQIPRPYVKWSYEIRRLEDLPRALHRAAKVALTAPTGPVFLSLPIDILNAEGDLDLGAPTRIDSRLIPSPESIKTAAEMLIKAASPIIVAGDAVAQKDAHAELGVVAELIGAPVYGETVSGTCNFPSSHPLALGPLLRSQKETRGVLEEADLLFSAGADIFTMSLPSKIDPVPLGLRIIHLHLDPWEIGKNYPAAVAIQGDPKATLSELGKALREKTTPDFMKEAQIRLERIRKKKETALAELRKKAEEKSKRFPITPLALMKTIGDSIPANAVVVDETITAGRALRALIKSEDPQSYFGLRGGGIGWGIPGALGIKIALPDRPVVSLVGDGSALYSIQGLWTAARYRLAVVFVICNNRGYQILKERTYALKGPSARTGDYIGMKLENPEIDFVGLANSLGVPGKRIDKIQDVRPTLNRAIAENTPFLIDVMIDPKFKE